MPKKYSSPPPWARKRKVEEAGLSPPSPRPFRNSSASNTGNKRPAWFKEAGFTQSPMASKPTSKSTSRSKPRPSPNSVKASNDKELDEAVRDLARWWKDELNDELYESRVQRIVDLCHCEPPGQRTFDKALIKFRSLGVHQNALDGLDEAFQVLSVPFMLGRVANCIRTPTALATAVGQLMTDTERLHGRIINQTLSDQLARLLDQIRESAPPGTVPPTVAVAAPTTSAVASNPPSSSTNGKSITTKPLSFNLPSVETQTKRPSPDIDMVVAKGKVQNMLATPSPESSVPPSFSDPRRGDERSRDHQVYEAIVLLPSCSKDLEHTRHGLEMACKTKHIPVQSIRHLRGNVWALAFGSRRQLDACEGRTLDLNRDRLYIRPFTRQYQLFVAEIPRHIPDGSGIHAAIARVIPVSRFCLQSHLTKWVLCFEDVIEKHEFRFHFGAPGVKVPIFVKFKSLNESSVRCFVCSQNHPTLECQLTAVVKPAEGDPERYLTKFPQIHTPNCLK